jgi:hypothetical protein
MAALIGPLVHVDPTEMCSLGVRRGAMQAVGLIFSCKVKPHTPHNIRSREAILISNEFKAFYTLFDKQPRIPEMSMLTCETNWKYCRKLFQP